jgi:hypothetical protein
VWCVIRPAGAAPAGRRVCRALRGRLPAVAAPGCRSRRCGGTWHAPGITAWITPNAISGDALGCNFALADGLMSKSPTRGHSTMKNHRSLRHMMLPAGRTAGGAHRTPSTGIAHTWAMRGILVLALTLSSLGAVALAWPGHVSTGHAQVSAQPRAHSRAHPGGLHLMVNKARPKPFMY